MNLPKQYRQHLEKAWRVVDARVLQENGESILNISLAKGVDSLIHDKIDLKRDAKRLAEFEQAVGDYGGWEELLDRRVSVAFDRHGAITDYGLSGCPLTAFWPTDWPR